MKKLGKNVDTRATAITQAILDKIEKELSRVYWNKHQKEIISPFANTGTTFKTPIFIVRAYNWDGNYKPNFEYKDFKVYWYKHSNRGLYIEYNKKITLDFLINMLDDCLESIEYDPWEGSAAL